MTEADDDFTVFVSTRQARLQRLAWLLCGDWAVAEDLTQTALAKTWRNWSRVMAADHPDAYVRRVLVNSHASSWRRRWRTEQPAGLTVDGPSDDAADALALRLSLQQALARLSRRQRAVIVLRYFEDLPEAQVALILDCAVGTVKSTASKALERLRRDPAVAGLWNEVNR